MKINKVPSKLIRKPIRPTSMPGYVNSNQKQTTVFLKKDLCFHYCSYVGNSMTFDVKAVNFSLRFHRILHKITMFHLKFASNDTCAYLNMKLRVVFCF